MWPSLAPGTSKHHHDLNPLDCSWDEEDTRPDSDRKEAGCRNIENCLELCCSFLLIAVYPLSTPSAPRFQAVWPLYSTVSGGVASLLQVHHGFRRCGLSTPSASRFQAVWLLYTKCLTVSGGVASLLQVPHGFRRCGLSTPSAPRFQAVWPLYTKCLTVSGGARFSTPNAPWFQAGDPPPPLPCRQ